jgi:transcriptional regulator with XRE-family HTH domain
MKRGWSQAELGKRSALPQMHISGIESGKIVPRFDSLLDLVRILGHDILLVSRGARACRAVADPRSPPA